MVKDILYVLVLEIFNLVVFIVNKWGGDKLKIRVFFVMIVKVIVVLLLLIVLIVLVECVGSGFRIV